MGDEPNARKIAADLLVRVDRDGAYANVLVPKSLDRGRLSDRDRAFVTELVYGTTRRRRACDHLVDRFLHQTDLDPPVRALLRLGAYQLVFLGTPPHAAVAETVAVAPKKVRGLVNAVLRRVAEAEPGWPDEATRLSYPDWILEQLAHDIGAGDTAAALEAMNEPTPTRTRVDGYVQDEASSWVTAEVAAEPGHRVADLCAAPGGKATALGAMGAQVVAVDRGAGRVRLLSANVRRWGSGRVVVARADGAHPPLRAAGFDRVLVDAPCSGLGALRGRPDARWRIEAAAVERLATLQRRILAEAVGLVARGGLLVYSVCTMTLAETVEIDRWLGAEYPDLAAETPVGEGWRPWGRGGLVLPQDRGTDGMAVFRYRMPAGVQSPRA